MGDNLHCRALRCTLVDYDGSLLRCMMASSFESHRRTKTGQEQSGDGGACGEGGRVRHRKQEPHSAQVQVGGGSGSATNDAAQACAGDGDMVAAHMQARAERAEELIKTLRAHLERARAQVPTTH